MEDRRYRTINDNAFDELTSEALYWLGWLATDGCLRQKNIISFPLGIEDRQTVEAFRAWLRTDYALQEVLRGDSEQVEIVFNSPRIYEKLLSFGFTGRKSLTLRVSDILAKSPDFWRGAICGDGSISMVTHTKPYGVYEYLTLELSTASRDFATQFIEFVKSIVPTYCVAYYYTDARKGRYGRSGNCKVYGLQAQKVLQELYYPNCYKQMSRKDDLAAAAIALPIVDREARNQLILDDYHGGLTRRQLREKYNLSKSQIREIVTSEEVV